MVEVLPKEWYQASIASMGKTPGFCKSCSSTLMANVS